jgi:peptidyl-tRNA hydrolase
MYALVRLDLCMSPGKTVAQAGHAYVGCTLACQQQDPSLLSSYHADFPASPGTKVCLGCPSLEKMLWARDVAAALGIPHYLVTDSGDKNFFAGEPTVTALGLGPATKQQIMFLKKFKLL